MPPPSALVKALFVLAIAAYPFLVYFGLAYFEARFVALILIAIALFRLVGAKRGAGLGAQLIGTLGVALTIGFVVAVSNETVFLRLYPVCINALMLALFAASVLRPPSFVERLIRLRKPDMPPWAIRYARKVTLAWCGFFLINGAIAFYTSFWTPLEVWTLYNGLIAYLLIGLMFAGEFPVRYLVKRANTPQPAIDDKPDTHISAV